MPESAREESSCKSALETGECAVTQLKTGMWVDALIRRAQVAGAFACIVQRGDRDAGSVLVCVRGRAALTLYTPERDMDGQRCWRPEVLDEEALTQRIEQRLNFDPDLMVVEIDDAQDRHFIEEAVLEIAAKPETKIKPESGRSPGSPSPQEAAADAVAAAKALFRDQ